MDEIELKKRLVWYEKKYGPYINKRGPQNWKNLFRKPTLQEVIILVLLAMAIFMALAYQQDIQNIKQNACEICYHSQNYTILLNEGNNMNFQSDCGG